MKPKAPRTRFSIVFWMVVVALVAIDLAWVASMVERDERARGLSKSEGFFVCFSLPMINILILAWVRHRCRSRQGAVTGRNYFVLAGIPVTLVVAAWFVLASDSAARLLQFLISGLPRGILPPLLIPLMIFSGFIGGQLYLTVLLARSLHDREIRRSQNKPRPDSWSGE